MAKVTKTQNCGNCEHCVSIIQNRRFRCTALPRNPGEWWDGFPEDHWCGTYWVEKKSLEKVTANKVQI